MSHIHQLVVSGAVAPGLLGGFDTSFLGQLVGSGGELVKAVNFRFLG